MDTERKLVFVYHFPCADGFTAAWAAYTEFGDEAEYLRESHGYRTTKDLLALPDAREWFITFLDICPPRDLLEKLYEHTGGNVQVLDHHKTAEENCGDLPYVYIDKTRSGAGIAWDVIKETDRPFLVNLVEDRDIWKWEIPDADKYLIWLDTMCFDFKIWDDCAYWLDDEIARKKILETGTHYKEYRDHVVYRGMITRRKLHAVKLQGHKLPCINAPTFQSQIGASLAKKSPNGAAAVYYRGRDYWYFSLRSKKGGLDVEKIARKYGGGGHARAAAFVVKSLGDLELGTDADPFALWPSRDDSGICSYTLEELDTLFPDVPEEETGGAL